MNSATGHSRVVTQPLDPVILDFKGDAAGTGRDQTAVGDGDAR
jgi:hypothetical protein